MKVLYLHKYGGGSRLMVSMLVSRLEARSSKLDDLRYIASIPLNENLKNIGPRAFLPTPVFASTPVPAFSVRAAQVRAQVAQARKQERGAGENIVEVLSSRL